MATDQARNLASKAKQKRARAIQERTLKDVDFYIFHGHGD
jgi:hypothetical protein